MDETDSDTAPIAGELKCVKPAHMDGNCDAISEFSWTKPSRKMASVPTSLETVEKPGDLDGNGHEILEV